MKIWIAGGLVLLVLLAAVWGSAWMVGKGAGYSSGYKDGVASQAKAVQEAKAAATQARQDATDSAQQLAAVREGLATLKTRLQAQIDHQRQLLAAAEHAARVREARLATQALAQAARDAAIRNEVTEDENCHALATVPVCPAVARRLWPDAAGDPDADPEPARSGSVPGAGVQAAAPGDH